MVVKNWTAVRKSYLNLKNFNFKIPKLPCLLSFTSAATYYPTVLNIDFICCQDAKGQIWHLDLSFIHTSFAPETVASFHAGPVLCCATSPSCPLFATGGSDCKSACKNTSSVIKKILNSVIKISFPL